MSCTDNHLDSYESTFQLEGFEDNEINIKVNKRKRTVTINAKHREKCKNNSMAKQLKRIITIPKPYEMLQIQTEKMNGCINIKVPSPSVSPKQASACPSRECPSPKRQIECPSPKQASACPSRECPSPKRQTECPSPKRQTECPSPKRQTECPSPKRQTECPSPKRQIECPSPKRQAECPPSEGSSICSLSECQLPEKSSECQLPKESSECQLPKESSECQLSKESSKCQMPKCKTSPQSTECKSKPKSTECKSKPKSTECKSKPKSTECKSTPKSTPPSSECSSSKSSEQIVSSRRKCEVSPSPKKTCNQQPSTTCVEVNIKKASSPDRSVPNSEETSCLSYMSKNGKWSRCVSLCSVGGGSTPRSYTTVDTETQNLLTEIEKLTNEVLRKTNAGR